MTIEDYKEYLEKFEGFNDEMKRLVEALELAEDENAELNQRNDALNERLEDARKSKKTIQKIESLEASVRELNDALRERDAEIIGLRIRIAEQSGLVKWAEGQHEFVKRLARRLHVKIENRTPASLMKAVDDAMRKLH